MPAGAAAEWRDKEKPQEFLENTLPVCAPHVHGGAIRTESEFSGELADVTRL
jgi:hypothetical protein